MPEKVVHRGPWTTTGFEADLEIKPTIIEETGGARSQAVGPSLVAFPCIRWHEHSGRFVVETWVFRRKRNGPCNGP